jgi:predicted glycosyltransferase
MSFSAVLSRPAGGTDVPESTDADDGLRVLCDVAHPAQAHLFRNALAELERRGHTTFVTSREKEVTVPLLDAHDIEHLPLSTRGESLPELLVELGVRERRLFAVARQFDPDVILSRLGPVPAHASALQGCRHVVVSDTSIDSTPMRLVRHTATLPFVDTVCAPPEMELPVSEEQRRALPVQELAYLHPRYFDPDPSVLRSLGVDPEERFFVVRTAGWDAYHDIGHSGLSAATLRELTATLSEHGRVFVSAEGTVPASMPAEPLDVPTADVHDVLHYADLYVGDSGTMSTEAAVLGTPAIRTNSMVGTDDEVVFKRLEHQYGLLESYADDTEALGAVDRLLSSGLESDRWEQRRRRLLAEQPDVTERIVETVLATTTVTHQ